jgi:hypothetical protein
MKTSKKPNTPVSNKTQQKICQKFIQNPPKENDQIDTLCVKQNPPKNIIKHINKRILTTKPTKKIVKNPYNTYKNKIKMEHINKYYKKRNQIFL